MCSESLLAKLNTGGLRKEKTKKMVWMDDTGGNGFGSSHNPDPGARRSIKGELPPDKPFN